MNSTSLFTEYETKFVNRKLFEPTKDIIKTVVKPFRVALISLLICSMSFLSLINYAIIS